MDVFLNFIFLGIVEIWIFLTEGINKPRKPLKTKQGDTSLETGYFVFAESGLGAKQDNSDPYINSKYDNGPDW